MVVPVTRDLGSPQAQAAIRGSWKHIEAPPYNGGEASRTPPTCALPAIVALVSPDLFLPLTPQHPTTAAAIILANFALAMWTIGWFLLYFVALSNIS